jgi:hypothetical protein
MTSCAEVLPDQCDHPLGVFDGVLARARVKGTKLGRHRVEPAIEARIQELRASGDGILKIGRKLGIGTSVVQRVFKEKRGCGRPGLRGVHCIGYDARIPLIDQLTIGKPKTVVSDNGNY